VTLSHHQRGAQVTPSPLNGERDGVRGEKGTKRSPSPAVAVRTLPTCTPGRVTCLGLVLHLKATRKQWLILCWMLWIALACAQTSAQTSGRFEFTRLVAHWSDYGNPEYLTFIDEVQPEVAQVGFYGAHFWSLVHTPQYSGYPAHFPRRGIAEASAWFADLNRNLHQRGVKVVGHFNVEFLIGDPDSPEGPRGFFRFYRDLWDDTLLGARPEKDPVAFLEKNHDGTPLSEKNYGIGGMKEYWACLRNPSWQKVLQAWIRRGIDLGLDGFIANYFYRHNCTCEHCVRAFRAYLAPRFTPAELRTQFGITNLATHDFPELVSWHDPAKSSPLRREMLRFSQISNKEVFDEVFVRYGRSLKPDLLVAQWNHLGDFSQVSGDERCLLPAERWGRDEDYLWYSLGGSANSTDLAKGFLGEGTLQARYIRGAFDDKPFTLGKYEGTRLRVAIGELAANGGAPMGFYTDFTKPASRAVLVQYYQFLKRYEPLFRANRPVAEAALLFPRRAVHAANLEPLKQFRDDGRALLDAHVLFDVLPDDLADPNRLKPYRQVFDLSKGAATEVLSRFTMRSQFQAPKTVRISASRPAHDTNEWDIHWVNYDRTEPARAADGSIPAGSGAQDEKPVAVSGVQADLLLPAGATVRSVEVITPERPDPVPVSFQAKAGRVRFVVPEFLSYAIARVRMDHGR